MSDFNIRDTLRKRLVEITDKKEDTQKKIVSTQDNLQKLFSKGIKSSRLTPEQLDAKIDELEIKRTTTSLSLSEEKAILREIDQIKKAKVAYEETRIHEQLIKEKKDELNSLRTHLTNYKAQVSELENALSKVELADRLGCTANDLKSHKVNCPASRVGQVIGKGGSNIKKLESKTGCLIDLDKVKNEIHLQGNEESIKKAILEIENITLAVEIDLKLSEALYAFLTNKGMAEFNKLQNNHENVFFDITKETCLLVMRGREHFVNVAKEAINRIDVIMEKIDISTRDAASIVGKGGKVVNGLVANYDVNIQVENISDEKSVVSVAGQGSKVMAAMKKINDILFKNEDIEVSILVTPMTRNKLLSDSGALIKKLQKDVNDACQPGNAFVRFEEVSDDERDTLSILRVKSQRMHIEKVEKVVKERIALYDSSVINMVIDFELIPVIIGPKGATIKTIRKIGGPGADVDINKNNGQLKLMADKEAGRIAMKNAIDTIVNENQILRVPMDSNMFGDLFGQIGKNVKSKIQNSGVFMKVDDSESAILLRGSIEKITVAANDIRQFIASNHIVELKVNNVDEQFLLRSTSMMKRIEKEFDVKVKMNKSRQSVIIRGREEKTNAAEDELKKVLYGGEGYSVEKLFVPSSIIGQIIGKSGKNIAKYEETYESIIVSVHSLTRCLMIRGPTDKVKLCKTSIMEEMMKAKVQEAIHLDEVSHEKLSKSGAMDKIIGDLPVTFTLVKETLRLKGAYNDVQEVMRHVEDLITGVYTSIITLIPGVYHKLKSAHDKDFEKIGDETSTSITFDDNMTAIKIEGKRSNVKRTKSMMIDVLEKMAPDFIAVVKFLRPLLPTVGSTKKVTSYLVKSGCDISLERDICTFILQSTSRKTLNEGIKVVQDEISSAMKRIYVVQVESWLMKYIVTKKKADVDKIKEQCGCDIVLSNSDFTISITAKEEGNVSNAKVFIDSIINQGKKENKFIDLPESSMKEFVPQMALLSSSIGAKIERAKKTKSRIFVHGDEAAVTTASTAIENWISKWETKNSGLVIAIERSTIRHLDKERNFGVKVDINRNKGTATIRGGENLEYHEKASKKLESVLTEKNEIKVTNKENGIKSAVPYVDNQVKASPVAEVEAKINDKKPNNAVGKLFDLLVSDDAATAAVSYDVQEWDSSTVSSGVESEVESPETGVSYYRSASGFHIRL